MGYLEVIVLSSQFLILLQPFITKPFQPFIFLHQFKHSVIPALAFSPLHESFTFSHCFYKGLQNLLAVLVERENALDEGAPSRS